LLLGESPSSQKKRDEGNENKPTHAYILTLWARKNLLEPAFSETQKNQAIPGDGTAWVGEVLRGGG
jgi:hypothetical protein